MIPHAQANLAIIQQQVGVRLKGCKDFLVGQIHPVGVTRCGVQVQAESIARVQFNAAIGKGTDPQLWPLHVGHDADGAAQFPLDCPDVPDSFCVTRMLAMAEIQAEDIDASYEQFADHLRRSAGRSQGGDDLGVAAAMHFLNSP